MYEHDIPCALEVNSNDGFKGACGVFHGVNVTLYTVNVFTVFTVWSGFLKNY